MRKFDLIVTVKPPRAQQTADIYLSTLLHYLIDSCSMAYLLGELKQIMWL